MVKIEGNTYSVREQLKALGGRWMPASKCWMVPDDKATAAQALVKPSKSGGRSFTGRKRVCATCGCKINYGVYCGKCEFGR